MRSSTSAFAAGDVLYGKLRPYLNKAVLAERSGVCTTELLVLRPTANVDPRFLAAALHSPSFVEYAIAGTSAFITRGHLGRTYGSMKCPHSTLRARADSRPALARRSINRAITEGDRTWPCAHADGHAHHLLGGLAGEVQKDTEIGRLPQSWETVRIGDVFTITPGLTLKGNLAAGGDGTPFLRTSNVYWGKVDIETISRCTSVVTCRPTRYLREGDLLVCEGGAIGRAAVWDGSIDGCLFQNHLHCLRPIDASRTDPRFLMAWLEEGFVHRNVYEGVGNRTTIPNLSALASRSW